MAESAPRQRVRRRRRWWQRRRALPRSRRALALGALLALVILAFLLVGASRVRPGREVPPYEPPATTTTALRGPVPPPIITRPPGPAPAPTAAPTTRGR